MPKRFAPFVIFLLQFLTLFVVYYATARAGLSFLNVNRFASLIWFPSALSLFFLFSFGLRLWTAPFLAAFLVNFSPGADAVSATGIATGNSLEALIGAALLRHFQFHTSLERLRDVVLLGLVSFFTTMLSASAGSLSLYYGGFIPADEMAETFRVWWLRDLASCLILGPLLFVWSSPPWKKVDFDRWGEALVIIFCSYVVFEGTYTILPFAPLLHLQQAIYVFPLIIWTALRFGSRGSTLLLAVLSFVAIWATSTGSGPFFVGSVVDSLSLLQLFLVVASLTGLFLSALMEERAAKEQRIRVQYEVMTLLSQSGQFREGLRSILEVICRNFDWQLGILWLKDNGEKVLIPASEWSSPELRSEVFLRASRESRFHPGQGLPGRIWNEKKPIWVESLGLDPAVARTPLALHDGFRTCFGFPITDGPSNVLGVVEFFCLSYRRPDQELLNCLSTLGGQMGQYLERKKAEAELISTLQELEDRVRQRTQELEVLYEKEHASRTAAEKAIRTKDELMAIVSHDLKNPLSVIIAGLEQIRRNQNEEVIERLFSMVKRSAETMGKLLRNLLDVQKMDAGAFSLHETVLESPEVFLRWVLDGQSPLALEKNIRFELDIPPGLPCFWLDRDELLRVFQNLIGNSLKFTPPGGAIFLRVRWHGEMLLFSVEDNGPGIEPELLPRLFDRFSQARSTAKLGTGLGLSIAKGIVKAHGGEIWAESSLGKGCKVYFTIPIDRGIRPRTTPFRIPPEAPGDRSHA